MHRPAAKTIPALVLEQHGRLRDRVLFGCVPAQGEIRRHTWGEMVERVVAVAVELQNLGFQPGDRGAIFAYNSPEWYVVDWAVQMLGGVSVPVYMNNTAEQAAYVLDDSGAKLVYVDNEARRDAVLGHISRLPSLVRVLTPDAIAKGERVEPLSALESRGRAAGEARAKAVKDAVAGIGPKSTATLSYTSGTTGEPKGVILSHENILETTRVCIEEMEIEGGPDERSMSYLPLAHIAQRMMDLTSFYHGAQMYFPSDIQLVTAAFPRVRPTMLVAVPRVLEKVKATIENKVAQAPAMRRRIFAWATKIAFEVAEKVQAGKPLGVRLASKQALADLLVFQKIRGAFGGECRMLLAGGAPLGADLGRFFLGVGLPTYEVFGLTETAAVISFDRPKAIRYGTVGKPARLGEVKIAEDGEILWRGVNVFGGYWKKEAQTAEAMEGGWFHTGDLGAFDADGFLKIIGRKKELIVTSAGKNVAPIPIEFGITRCTLVDQVMVVGDEKNYLTALLTLNLDEAKRRFGADRTLEALAEAARPALAAHIDQVNATLARYETVKKFEVLTTPWSTDGGELTPSLKMKRRVIAQKYRDRIEKMYSQPVAESA